MNDARVHIESGHSAGAKEVANGVTNALVWAKIRGASDEVQLLTEVAETLALLASVRLPPDAPPNRRGYGPDVDYEGLILDEQEEFRA